MSNTAPAWISRTGAAAAAAALGVALALAAAAPDASAAKPEDLPPPHRQFLEDVQWLITPAERREFLALEHDHQREAFIDRFWEARDPYPETARNELEDAWYARLEHVMATYRNQSEDRARILMIQGQPQVHIDLDCRLRMWPLEVWRYDAPAGTTGPIYALFFQPRGVGTYRLWQGKHDGLAILFSETPGELRAFCERQRAAERGIGRRPFEELEEWPADPAATEIDIDCALRNILRFCKTDNPGEVEEVVGALTKAYVTDRIGSYALDLSRLERRPEPREEEWLATFRSYSTDLPEDAASFAVDPYVDFPRREGGRTVVRVELAVPTEGVEPVELEGRRSYDFSLTGEVLRDGKMFESFRYRFDAPEAGAGDRLSLVFQRLLRPGDFRLVLRLEDLHGGGFWRREIDLRVPDAEELAAAAAAAADAAREVGATGGAAAAGGRPAPAETARIELGGPADGPLTGMTRFDARVTGEAARVAFFLDGRRVMSKTRPPFSLELDLGPVPRPHTVRAVALDADGRRLAAAELAINAGAHRFAVRIASPESGEVRSGPTEVRVELAVPEGERLDRLELFVGEEPVAALYQEPWLHVLDLPAEPVYLRAVAYLADGASREAVAFVNVTDPIEEMQVRLVELYAAVVDGTGRPVTDLGRGDFRVVENGVPQEIVRFERVTDRPIHVVLMIDSSASMEGRIEAVRHAAAAFLARTLTPKDRAAVVPFADRTVQDVELTADAGDLTVGLAALQAERGTALYDNLISVLYHLNGVQGQRAILLLSDGQDRSSRFTFAEAREFARAAGVAIYTVGIDLPLTQVPARRELAQLAAESGGRSFFVADVAELDAVYAAIESELRSKYLLVYQSTATGTDFRQVEVEAARPGLEVKAMRGYWP